MSVVVSFERFLPPARYDALPWTEARIEESADEDGSYTQIDIHTLSPVDADPANPEYRSFTTELGTDDDYWYRVVFADADGDISIATVPIQNSGERHPDHRRALRHRRRARHHPAGQRHQQRHRARAGARSPPPVRSTPRPAAPTCPAGSSSWPPRSTSPAPKNCGSR